MNQVSPAKNKVGEERGSDSEAATALVAVRGGIMAPVME